jgi:predicted nucleotidyltransferase
MRLALEWLWGPDMPQELAVSENVRLALAELRRCFEQSYGDRLVHLILYGSQARGDAQPWSDIDLVVVLKGPVDDRQEWKRAEEFIARVCLEFDVVTTPIFMSEDEYLSGDRALHRNIRQEGVVV